MLGWLVFTKAKRIERTWRKRLYVPFDAHAEFNTAERIDVDVTFFAKIQRTEVCAFHVFRYYAIHANERGHHKAKIVVGTLRVIVARISDARSVIHAVFRGHVSWNLLLLEHDVIVEVLRLSVLPQWS